MARTLLTKTVVPASYDGAGVLVVETAADQSIFNNFQLTGQEILLIHNTDTNPQTYTVTSAPDPQGRTKDITTEAIAAGAVRVAPRFKLAGWMQTDGTVWLQAPSALVKFAVLQIPPA